VKTIRGDKFVGLAHAIYRNFPRIAFLAQVYSAANFALSPVAL